MTRVSAWFVYRGLHVIQFSWKEARYNAVQNFFFSTTHKSECFWVLLNELSYLDVSLHVQCKVIRPWKTPVKINQEMNPDWTTQYLSVFIPYSIKEHFWMAKRCICLQQYHEVAESAKEHVKAKGLYANLFLPAGRGGGRGGGRPLQRSCFSSIKEDISKLGQPQQSNVTLHVCLHVPLFSEKNCWGILMYKS